MNKVENQFYRLAEVINHPRKGLSEAVSWMYTQTLLVEFRGSSLECVRVNFVGNVPGLKQDQKIASRIDFNDFG